MRWILRAVFALAGMSLLAVFLAPTKPRTPVDYDLHSDPEYIAMTRQQGVKLSNMSWRMGGFDTVIVASFTIENARAITIKDVVVKCEVSAASGTMIAAPRATVLRAIPPGQKTSVRDLSIGFVPNGAQASAAKCYVDGHQDG